jgi:DNA-binding SARP family transcriptional activator
MLAFLRRRFAFRRRVEAKAERLIAEYGEDAWSAAYEICTDLNRSEEVRRFYSQVRYQIERKLGIPPRVDTATRYLEQD